MRKIIAAIFTFIAKTIAAFFALLFVISGILVLLVLNIDRTLLQSTTYKRALAENKVYEQLPILVAEEFSTFKTFLADPCAANPLACAIDGASPELQLCLTDALGESEYVEIGSGKRSATEAELDVVQTCLDQFGKPALQPGPEAGSADENPLLNASTDIQACARDALGEETYDALYSNERPPTEEESQQINDCFEQAGQTPPIQPGENGANQMSFLSNMSTEQWQELFLLLLPPEDLQPMTESTLDQIFAYVNGETETATVSLVDLKARLADPDLVLFLLNAQPPCTEEQLIQIQSADFGEEGNPIPLCAASGANLDIFLSVARGQLDQAVSQIPDQATIIKPPSATDSTVGTGPLGKNPHEALQMVNIAINLSPLLPLAFLLLVTLFGVRSLKGWLLWWGVPLFIVGLVVLIFGIAILPLLEWAWVNYAVQQIPSMFSTASLIATGHGVVFSIARDLTKWIVISSSLIALLGLGAIIGSSRVKPKTLEPVPLEAPPENEQASS